jgi:HSP20 family molecular chaperone IbpA
MGGSSLAAQRLIGEACRLHTATRCAFTSKEDAMNSWTPWLLSASACDDVPSDHARSGHDRFTPLFTIHETPDAYDIESELSRSARRDISVKPHRHHLEIQCGRAIDHEEPDTDNSTPRFGPFVARLPLSEAIDVAHTKATFRHGVLHIYAPKRH